MSYHSRVATPAVTVSGTGTGTGTGTGELTRVVSGKELATVIMSKIYENDIKCDENNEGIEIQGEGDLDLEERRSEDSAGKGAGAGAFTLDTVQGGGISRRKAKRPKRY